MKDSSDLQETVNRAIEEAEYIVATGCTVRECAKHFGVCKSTVHKDVTERMQLAGSKLTNAVRVVLATNKREAARRGGRTTQERYAGKKRNERNEVGNYVGKSRHHRV